MGIDGVLTLLWPRTAKRLQLPQNVAVPDKPFRLMDLPVELRLAILEMCSIDIDPTSFVVAGKAMKQDLPAHLVSISEIWPSQLICTNSVIRKDFETIFLKMVRQRVFAVRWGSSSIDEADDLKQQASAWITHLLRRLDQCLDNGKTSPLQIQLMLDTDSMILSSAIQSMWMRAHCPGSLLFPFKDVELGFLIVNFDGTPDETRVVIERMQAVREKARQLSTQLDHGATPRSVRKDLIEFSSRINSVRATRRHEIMLQLGMGLKFDVVTG